MGNIIVVQQVRTTWTKASRGGENAGRRNAVLEVARVPVERIPAGNLVLAHHSLSYGEGNGFAQSTEEVQVNPPTRPLVIGCVNVDYSEEAVTVTFHWDYRCGGAPDRGWARKTLHVRVNEWGQIVYNGRFNSGWDGPWYYQKMVVNVGLFERLTPGLFTRQEPTCHFSAMAELF
jgi:hypothetical protein